MSTQGLVALAHVPDGSAPVPAPAGSLPVLTPSWIRAYSRHVKATVAPVEAKAVPEAFWSDSALCTFRFSSPETFFSFQNRHIHLLCRPYFELL